MIDLNRIRSMKTLEEMKEDLTTFLNDPIMLEVYVEDFQWGPEDLEADRESATELLEKVEKRMVSLKRFLTREPISKEKKDEKPSTAEIPTEVPAAP